MSKKLYRSRRYRVIGGVCGGLGAYFHIDPVIFRIIWAALAIPFFFAAILLYLISLVLIPLEPTDIEVRPL